MRLRPFVETFLITALVATASTSQASPKEGRWVAEEAVNIALALPPGYERDGVLRAVSRNLRWFGFPNEGRKAVLAMSDHGKSEYPETNPRKSIRQPDQRVRSCRAGLWREDDGSEATSTIDREAWTKRCILDGEYHFTGLPDVAVVRAAAADLPAGDVKAATLSRLITSYGDPDTLDFVASELERSELSGEHRGALRRMLQSPSALYARGAKSEAIAAAKQLPDFNQKSALVIALVRDGDVNNAIAVFDTMIGSPPPTGDGTCLGWFNPFGGLYLSYLGNAMKPSLGVRDFLNRLPASPTFHQICPSGFDAETAVEYFLAAGQFDMAIQRAEQAPDRPFILVDALLQSARAKLRSGDVKIAREIATRAGAAIPAFSPAERPGDTGRRFQVIQLLAATGATSEADSLAHAQPAGAMRAVALSAAAAGRAGIRFDERAPMLSEVSRLNL